MKSTFGKVFRWRWDVILGLFGLALAAVAFYIDSVEKFPALLRVIAPHYAEGIALRTSALKEPITVTVDDPGFDAILPFIEEKVGRTGITTISFGVAEIGSIAGKPMPPRWPVEVTFVGNVKVPFKVEDFADDLKGRHLENRLFLSSHLLLWAGLISAGVVILLGLRKPT